MNIIVRLARFGKPYISLLILTSILDDTYTQAIRTHQVANLNIPDYQHQYQLPSSPEAQQLIHDSLERQSVMESNCSIIFDTVILCITLKKYSKYSFH